MNSKIVLTATAVLIGFFGAAWLVVPAVLGNFWAVAPGDNFTYMGHRDGALLLGLAVTAWLARNAPNTQARRALMIGSLVALALLTGLSAYGALALGLNTWGPVVAESLFVVGFVWVLFIKPEPVV